MGLACNRWACQNKNFHWNKRKKDTCLLIDLTILTKRKKVAKLKVTEV